MSINHESTKKAEIVIFRTPSMVWLSLKG